MQLFNPANTKSAGMDDTAQQLELQKRLQFAQALRNESQAPIENEVSGGAVVPLQWTQGAAKLLQAFGANQADKMAIQQASDYAAQKRARLAAALSGIDTSSPDAMAKSAQRLMGEDETRQYGAQLLMQAQQQAQARQFLQNMHGGMQPPRGVQQPIPPQAGANIPAQPGQQQTPQGQQPNISADDLQALAMAGASNPILKSLLPVYQKQWEMGQIPASEQAKLSGPTNSIKEFEYAQKNGFNGSFSDWKTLKQKARANGGQPFFQAISTVDANGNPVLGRFNARTGEYEPLSGANGAPVVKASDSASLQGDIAGSKAGQAALAKSRAETQSELNGDVAMLPQLEDSVNKLSELGKKATYTLGGQAVDWGRRQAGMEPREAAVAREEYINRVRDQVLPLLRSTFGAQFTAKEGESLLATLGDPNKAPAEKDAALRAFIDTKKQTIASKQRQVGAGPAPAQAPPAPSNAVTHVYVSGKGIVPVQQ